MCFSTGDNTKPHQPWRGDPNVSSFYDWGGDPTGGSYEGWEDAKYRYEKDKAEQQYNEQMAMQNQFMEQEAAYQAEQLKLQQDLHSKQLDAQSKLQAMQEQMAQKQLDSQRAMEAQRLAMERAAMESQKEMDRQMEEQMTRSKTQQRFQAGRGDNRKNPTGSGGNGGTSSLQIGLGSKPGEAGLQIPK